MLKGYPEKVGKMLQQALKTLGKLLQYFLRLCSAWTRWGCI